MQQLPASTSNTPHTKKRTTIIAAALRLFARRGFHGTTVPDVAADAHVGMSALYRLFPSKDALVNAVFVDAKERLEKRLVMPRDQEPKATFRALWDALVTFAREEPDAFHFLELQDHTPYLDGSSRAVEMRVLTPIFLLCNEWQARGILRDDVPADAMMAFIWGGIVGLLKAERTGYLKLATEAQEATCHSAWRAFATKKKHVKPVNGQPLEPSRKKRT